MAFVSTLIRGADDAVQKLGSEAGRGWGSCSVCYLHQTNMEPDIAVGQHGGRTSSAPFGVPCLLREG